MAVSDKDKARLRIIRFLSRGAAHASYVPGGRNVLLDGAERGTVSVCAEVLRAATKDGLVEKRAGKLVRFLRRRGIPTATVGSRGSVSGPASRAGGNPYRDAKRRSDGDGQPRRIPA